MRYATVLFALVSWGLAGGQPAWSQSDAQPAVFRQTVARDTETRVASLSNIKVYDGTACMTRFIPTVELVTAPQHGTVRFDTADVGAPKGSGCNNSVTGTVVLYRPNPGFIGKDQFTYKVQADPMAMDHTGTQNPLHSMIVTVR